MSTAAVTTLCYLLALLSTCRPLAGYTQPQLTFAESLYARLSGACRAMVDLRYTSLPSQDVYLVKTMKIIHIDGSIVRMFPINEAFNALTQNTLFDISKQTKVIIHGFRDNSHSAASMDIANAYNEKKMFNVILLDAEELMNKWYILSVHNTRLIGKRLANLLANLENFGASAEDFHLLGISLGAHIAGLAGKYYQKYKGRRVGRITGLDPAGPCFSLAYSEQRLDKSDATYVDVLHSNRLVQGVMEPLGHADFYINGGGPIQPGCLTPSCSHLRAANVYAESIKTPKSFLAVKCESWNDFLSSTCDEEDMVVLGYGCPIKTRGLYYLRTSASSPLGLGVEGTKNVEPGEDTWLKALNFK